ncbi:putative transposase [Vigna unguiculata]|uniref:Putative transposase n=1 Tax=Vigna unguiculata TaxID=3917 RepID=A0A4D6M6C2_VIGUN|nr:putative transposase [Vigna unguiculata]
MLGLSCSNIRRVKSLKTYPLIIKQNRASASIEALHSTGHKSNLKIALRLERKHGRHVNANELFLVIHKKILGEIHVLVKHMRHIINMCGIVKTNSSQEPQQQQRFNARKMLLEGKVKAELMALGTWLWGLGCQHSLWILVKWL